MGYDCNGRPPITITFYDVLQYTTLCSLYNFTNVLYAYWACITIYDDVQLRNVWLYMTLL